MKPDEAFLSDLERSRASVSRFASICRAAGVNIWTGPTVVRPSAVAQAMGRQAIGVELNPEYAEIAARRCA